MVVKLGYKNKPQYLEQSSSELSTLEDTDESKIKSSQILQINKEAVESLNAAVMTKSSVNERKTTLRLKSNYDTVLIPEPKTKSLNKGQVYKGISMNWKQYHRLEVIHTFLNDLEYNYPAICTVDVIGSSLEGRALKILKISNSNANNSGVCLDAGIHGREWIAPAVATYIANSIVKNFDSMPEYITNEDWYILPVMNPDGYEYSHTDDRMWRKDRAWHQGQCVGVDLNRNFRLIFNTVINIWKEERSTMDVMVEGTKSAQIAGMLHERDIPYSIAIGDVGLLLDKERGITPSKYTRTLYSKTTAMDWKNYHRLDIIYNFMDKLAADYPYLCAVYNIGRSVEGRDIKMLKISNGHSSNRGVWLDGSIHPREWISTAVVTYIADRLVKHFNDQPEWVTNKDWYILPVMNPDGYEYTHTHDRMWRKNRAKYGECIGVDLNRNFSYGWGNKGEEGSSEDPGNIFYRGPKPFSEPESLALKRVITESNTKFKVFLSFHSYGEVIIFPWGYTAETCPDYLNLLEGGAAMSKAIHNTNGHTYRVGSTKDLMYFAAGTSIDWSYGAAKIPFSYMVELKGKKHRFLLPKEEIVGTAVEIMNGITGLLQFVDERD